MSLSLLSVSTVSLSSFSRCVPLSTGEDAMTTRTPRRPDCGGGDVFFYLVALQWSQIHRDLDTVESRSWAIAPVGYLVAKNRTSPSPMGASSPTTVFAFFAKGGQLRPSVGIPTVTQLITCWKRRLLTGNQLVTHRLSANQLIRSQLTATIWQEKTPVDVDAAPELRRMSRGDPRHPSTDLATMRSKVARSNSTAAKSYSSSISLTTA
ncbi:hypothetical protein TIFTF001_032762 [Ficus carica]|uniref:Secreted protein n=1 Tax=Ficus carica TaxID=3494 RepID=A0AA88DXR8_FICCA|nr:hypothetical protein TIFTF001_032762 [Ficus carica]